METIYEIAERLKMLELDFQAHAAISEITSALRDLYDEQSGEPFETWCEQRKAAYRNAGDVLKKYEAWNLR